MSNLNPLIEEMSRAIYRIKLDIDSDANLCYSINDGHFVNDAIRFLQGRTFGIRFNVEVNGDFLDVTIRKANNED